MVKANFTPRTGRIEARGDLLTAAGLRFGEIDSNERRMVIANIRDSSF